MYKLSCKDIGAADCDFEATGETPEEVMQKMKEHAKSAHPEKLASMNMSEEDMDKMMREKIQQV